MTTQTLFDRYKLNVFNSNFGWLTEEKIGILSMD